MLPSSHLAPSSVEPSLPDGPDALLLADAFSHFIAAAGTLENSYRELQREVAELGSALATRNRELEQSLQANEGIRRALVELLDSLPCGVLVLSGPNEAPSGEVEDAVLLRMNREARHLLGVAEGNPRSLRELAARTGVDLAPFCNLKGESKIALSLQRAQGASQQAWMELRSRELPHAPGMGLVLILNDISAQKQAEEERESGRNALALAEVAATLAHEIRNPLASLELFGGLLETDPGNAEHWLGHLRAGLRSLGGTVNNVLAFHGNGFSPLRPLILGQALSTAAEFVRPVTTQAGLTLETSGLLCEDRVMANPEALQQLVLNLVSNATRHTEPGGTITLSLARNGDALRLTVFDTGCGIMPEHLPHIFAAGWSGGASGSSGLGLAICQRIARQHGAELTVTSELGCGTCFSLELPIA